MYAFLAIVCGTISVLAWQHLYVNPLARDYSNFYIAFMNSLAAVGFGFMFYIYG